MAEHDRGGDPAYCAIYEGVVTDRADPLRIGRVKVRVPGVLEPESDWALPAAVPGGGEAGLGLYAIPKVGAEVAVWFVQGDTDRPRYAPGHWGAPRGQPQSPTPVRDLSPAEAPDVVVLETDRFLLVFDHTIAGTGWEIRDKVTGDAVKYDALTASMELSATVAVKIRAVGAVSIDAASVSIANRVVVPNGRPIT